MTGEEFLRQLEEMLADVTEEERREALRYYEEYLRDAGPEQEQQVLAELGSPARVAAIIRANVPGSRAESARATPPPSPDPAPLRIRGLAPGAGYTGTGAPAAAAQAASAPAGGGRTALWWLLVLVTSPLWLCVLAVLLGLLAAVAGVIVGVAAVLLSLVLAGVICLFAGGAFAVMSLPGLAADLPNGLVGLASCLAAMGIGALLLAAGWAVCGRGVPALFRALGGIGKAGGRALARLWAAARRAVEGGV